MAEAETRRIGNYQLVRQIADRGVVQSYEALHVRLKRKTFLKIYHGGDESLLARFEREASIVASLKNDALVQIYDFGEDEGKYFIAMEFVDGDDLEQYLNHHDLSGEEKIRLCWQIAESVSVLHQHGIVHRDLKPANILITRDGSVKITDFGLATQETMNAITHSGGILGTPLYMAPEQINNYPPTPAVDVFALGVIYYQLFTSTHPFYAEQMSTVFANILSKDPPSVRTVNPDVPEAVEAIVTRMLQKDPARRFQSALEVATAFRKLLQRAETDEAAPQPIAPAVSAEGPQNKGIQRILLAAVFVLTLILLGLWYWGRQSSSGGVPVSVADSLSVVSDTASNRADTTQPVASTTPVENTTPNGQIPSPEGNTQTPPPEKPDAVLPKPARLLIKTFPWARVYLDYQFIDVTPMRGPLEIRPGKYLLSLQNPDYPSYSDSITVQGGKLNVFTYNLDSLFVRLNLVVVPWGVVFIDGVKIGVTPLDHPILLTREPHVIEITNEFYQTFRDTIRPDNQTELNYRVVLKELPISGTDG